MKTQIYLCVDLKAMTQDTHFHPQESRTGILTMQDEDNFFFYEAEPQRERRNPRLWSGKMLNISRKSDGQLSVKLLGVSTKRVGQIRKKALQRALASVKCEV